VALADPELVGTVHLGTGRVPLAMDLEAPLDATRALGPGIFRGLRYLLRADTFSGKARVSFLQPYDPAKRPLVLIHGLMTTPRMWDRLVRELLADPCVREQYQIWFFYYPTAQPVPLSAVQLRNALNDAVAWHDVRQPMVLVGYSMGGVLARAQVSALTLEQAERILPGVSDLPKDHLARQALVFEPRADVSRTVFMFTPHRGSRLATLNVAVWATRLIRLPDWVRNEASDLINAVRGLPEGRLPTSIQGLSPRSRFLAELDRAPPAVPAHTILGNRGRRHPLRRSSDGVVPYRSAHLPAAVSEVVVPTGHGGFDHPKSIAELKRILRLDIQTGAEGRPFPPACARPAAGEG
jgi:pimeloyl-ACP methyl ester carboxylesterase